ncbi:DUF6157 family protein [Pseudonocardia ailaonensis]|uniref:DUF6157 family protein n=1 Tax=Pseudonocardia ailaonensis TaxID=367279 RepID=A0ABN2N7V7_9PSEU
MQLESVDYVDTFIAVSEDCPVPEGTVPPDARPTIASLSFRMLAGRPYELTSGDVLFGVHAERRGIPEEERAAARAEFFAKPQPCLRASDLGRRYGWGLHADGAGRLALVGAGTPEYAEFAEGRFPTTGGERGTVRRAMRRARKK